MVSCRLQMERHFAYLAIVFSNSAMLNRPLYRAACGVR